MIALRERINKKIERDTKRGKRKDIFDHILAAVPYFQLEVFEYPTGKDFVDIMEKKK